MTWTTTTLAICAALTLGQSACKGGGDDVAEDKAKPAEKASAAGGEAGGPEVVVTGEEKPAEEKPAEEKPAEEKPAADDSKVTGVAGTYTSDGITLVISNASKTQFDFQVSSPMAEGEEEDPCGGLRYKGVAKFDAADAIKATTEFEGTLRFADGGVHFEPSMDMIGMECMRRIDVEFKRSAT